MTQWRWRFLNDAAKDWIFLKLRGAEGNFLNTAV